MSESNSTEGLLPSLITEHTRGLLVLHHYHGKSKTDEVNPPFMRGYLETIDGRVHTDAFKEEGLDKRTYLRLVIGHDGYVPVVGVLYRAENYFEGGGWILDEKSKYKRTGTIDVNGQVLQIAGELKASRATGVPYIRAKVMSAAGAMPIDLNKYF